jgi:outer membrane lipoprotein SlyB
MACVGRWIVGVFAVCLLGIPPASAAAAVLRVDAFDVEQVARLDPGTALQFSVFATPGASATVLVEGVRRLVDLREVEPGIYEGRHVIEGGDRIRPGSSAVATVWRDGAVVRATLEESLLLDGAPPVSVAAPAVTPEPPPSSRSLPAEAPVVERSPVPYQVGNAFPGPLHAPPAPQAERRAHCRDCAVVESIRAVEVPTGPAYAGAVAGGIAGALFGDQVGKAHERHVARVLGAIGGAVLGHEIQRAATRRTFYDATLRMPNGSLRVRRYDALPPFQVGQRIPVGVGSTAAAAPTL